jgi:hypothetical protein
MASLVQSPPELPALAPPADDVVVPRFVQPLTSPPGAPFLSPSTEPDAVSSGESRLPPRPPMPAPFASWPAAAARAATREPRPEERRWRRGAIAALVVISVLSVGAVGAIATGGASRAARMVRDVAARSSRTSVSASAAGARRAGGAAAPQPLGRGTAAPAGGTSRRPSAAVAASAPGSPSARTSATSAPAAPAIVARAPALPTAGAAASAPPAVQRTAAGQTPAGRAPAGKAPTIQAVAAQPAAGRTSVVYAASPEVRPAVLARVAAPLAAAAGALADRSYARARAKVDSVIAVAPRTGAAYTLRARVRLGQHQLREAWADAEMGARLGDAIAAEAVTAMVDAEARDSTTARTRARRLAAALAGTPAVDPREGTHVAMALATVGDNGAAIDVLRRVRPVTPAVWVTLRDPAFDALRGSPKYQAVIQSLRSAGSSAGKSR